MSRQAPPNYVAGLGRGASGFVTASDLGGIGDVSADNDQQFQDPDSEVALFKNSLYEADDEEADRIWEEVEAKMDERRKSRREKKELEDMERIRKEKPKIQQQFADLKRDLAHVTNDEWASLPEVGDLVRKKGKRQKGEERFSAVPDSVITSAMDPGMVTSIGETDGLSDFSQFGRARDKLLSIKLDQLADPSSSSTVDLKGYLNELGAPTTSAAEISDIKKARNLLRSVISTNPTHAPGWIAAARLEEVATKLAQARDLIAQGCEACPRNEDIWIEAARLNNPETAKTILANAVRHIPTSIKIWLLAKELEKDFDAQKRVLRRALEFIPDSVDIWKATISAEENPEDAKILLSRAVECVPLSIELWIALALLEDYTNAKKILNKARQVLPTSHEIWITAARLEEKNSDQSKVEMIISRAIPQLGTKGCALVRSDWLEEAAKCELDGFVGVCRAIVKAVAAMDIEEAELLSQLVEDADHYTESKSIETARAIYASAVDLLHHEAEIWRNAAFFEQAHGNFEQLEAILESAIGYCPQEAVLWLMLAKGKWLRKDLEGAKKTLERAFAANPDSEQVWLAAVKLESETGSLENARALLEQARQKADTEKVWVKSVTLERKLEYHESALGIIKEGLQRMPKSAKLWMLHGQIQSRELADTAGARETYSKALKHIPSCTTIWILASRLEESASSALKGRVILEKARILNKDSPDIWLESIRVEQRSGNTAMARALLAKALQSCPKSGLILSQAILMEARPQRKARSADALRACDNEPLVIMTIARLFWEERKIEKARTWFERASKTNPDLGDIYGYWLKFEMQHGKPEQVESVFKACESAQPRHGQLWQVITKEEAPDHCIRDQLSLLAAQIENKFE